MKIRSDRMIKWLVIFSVFTFGLLRMKAQLPDCGKNMILKYTYKDSVNPSKIYFTGYITDSTGNPLSDNFYYQWDFGDNSGITSPPAKNMLHQYSNNGTYFVCFTVFKFGVAPCQKQFCDSVKVGVPNGVPFFLRQLDGGVKVYPNIASTTATIEFSLGQEQQVFLEVYDVLGRRTEILYTGLSNLGQHKILFDAAAYLPGTYFLKLTTRSWSAVDMIQVIR